MNIIHCSKHLHEHSTVLPAKSDSDVALRLQLLSITLTKTKGDAGASLNQFKPSNKIFY